MYRVKLCFCRRSEDNSLSASKAHCKSTGNWTGWCSSIVGKCKKYLACQCWDPVLYLCCLFTTLFLECNSHRGDYLREPFHRRSQESLDVGLVFFCCIYYVVVVPTDLFILFIWFVGTYICKYLNTCSMVWRVVPILGTSQSICFWESGWWYSCPAALYSV